MSPKNVLFLQNNSDKNHLGNGYCTLNHNETFMLKMVTSLANRLRLFSGGRGCGGSDMSKEYLPVWGVTMSGWMLR